jgi:hypothetical protein
MKITSEELGKLFVAFGTAMMQGAELPMVAKESMPDNTASTHPVPDSNTISGSFEAPVVPVTQATPTAEARIAELESQLANFHTQQNQSGLDLKPINL